MSEDATRTELTATGRFAHFASTRLAGFTKMQSRLHTRLYTRYGGTRFGKWLGRPIFKLTVVGRKSGQPRSVVLMYVPDGEELLVCGSNGGTPKPPNWWHNLVAAGRAEVQVGAESWPVTARVVTDAQEYERRWQVLLEHYPDFATYQALTERKLPIAVLARADS
ncbi:MAG TPA: nitroreductase family deazaflavin-dependent oxidoreductase [Nocardia sp.]|uniref:nitroreductase family deazaflavin-dependent oxidoreductase n=1 Tax=Nocardia TaxID=1817 RepID=UPI00245690CA|nr:MULTISPECIES: nitroreductase family deazaflavin-dependent oxidoreductase [Nocardia]HLS77286.1 nitroreductase family deazaflavin-dependent oxidoreductase [Nocardia sp.]